MIKQQEITSFDKTEHTLCKSVRPEKYDDIFNIRETPLIARGAGLSYCNAGASAAGIVVDMRRMNKILAFDSQAKTITVEAGISVGELNNFLISRNFILPVLPGYPMITAGGCIAFNIHGKSQFKVGTFGDWVQELNVYHPVHGEMVCSPQQNKELFNLTIGGFGLTGIIISAKLGFKTLPGGNIQSERIFVKNIFEAVSYMRDAENNYEYVYSWNDLNRKNTGFGRGIVYLEKYVQGKTAVRNYSDKMPLSYKLPALHSDLTVTAMCSVYYQLEKLKSKTTKQDLMQGSFPLYNKEIYYYLFGKKGFREYQMLIPYKSYEKAFNEIQQLIQRNKIAVALGSLKLFNGTTHQLSFSGEGVCLTIDVQESHKAITFFRDLDAVCVKFNAIVNLSKDSRADHSFISAVFPGFEEFRKKIQSFDPGNVISSELKTRINLNS